MRVNRGSSPRRVTLIYPYYENPIFLETQLDHLANEIPLELRRNLTLIIVDDGSPEHSAESVLLASHWSKIIGLRLFRIDVDVRWNWLAARNIAAHNADTQWISLTDMDHVYPEDTLRCLVYGLHDPSIIYRFSRIGDKTHPHPNSWFMTRDMFWQIGGYDEDASGYYGTDGDYRRRCAATAPVEIMDEPLELREYRNDSSTTRYGRKEMQDATGKQILRDKSRKGLPPRTLSFPHHEVALP